MTLLYLERNGAPMDEGDIRSTTNVVDPDGSEAVAVASPDFNSMERDPDTEGGLTTRGVADKVAASEQYLPLIGNANTDFAAPINSQVSTAGTAAAREAAGQWGHGSAQWTEAIEPTIRPGTEFDRTYFRATRPPIQDGALDYMIPARRPDTDQAASDQAASANASRAAMANLYQSFLESR